MTNAKDDDFNNDEIDLAELQFEMLAQEFETEDGRKRIGDDAYQEALAENARGSIRPKKD
ncbi:hypothetical protein [Sessilibacter sp. MAH4]